MKVSCYILIKMTGSADAGLATHVDKSNNKLCCAKLKFSLSWFEMKTFLVSERACATQARCTMLILFYKTNR